MQNETKSLVLTLRLQGQSFSLNHVLGPYSNGEILYRLPPEQKVSTRLAQQMSTRPEEKL